MFDTDDLLRVLDHVARTLIAACDQLNQLDAAVGDGDLGISLGLGFCAIQSTLEAFQGQDDIDMILSTCGAAFQSAAPSTMGTLIATAFLAAAQPVKGKHSLCTSDAMTMMTAVVDAVRHRGKAEVGDKTMLDALAPAAMALTTALGEGLTMPEAADRMVTAAESGMRTTAALTAKIGRASWVGERGRGHQDGGATAVYLILAAACSECHLVSEVPPAN